MNKLEFWIENGCLVSHPETTEADGNGQGRSLQNLGRFVKVETSEAGTTIKWLMSAGNWASLFFVQDWLRSLPPPYSLRFFNAGWFRETYSSPSEASARIGQLIGKADVRFSSRAFTRSFVPDVSKLPPRLRQSWEAGSAPPDATVVCSIDPVTGISQVESVGHASAIASIWGVSPVTYPCLTGHSYDRVVSNAYHEVLKTRRPNFSHVIAAMTQPDGEVQWYGYQRLVFPGHVNDMGHPTVNVVGHVSQVEIPLL
jgi:hypothetical protein